MTDDFDDDEAPETSAEAGSLPLPNSKQEIFAHKLSWGVSQAESYELAGFTPNSSNASRLANTPAIMDRVAWLKQRIAEAAVFDGAWIKERMGHLADALTEIRLDPRTGDRKPGPMFHAQAGARVLELLGREQGIFKDKIELGGQVAVGNTDMLRRMKPEQRSALKDFLLGVREQPPMADNDDAAGPEKPQGGVVRGGK